jgi:hypothetical protein
MNEKPLRANAEQEEMKKELKRSIDYRLNDLKEKYTSQLDGATEDDLQREKRLFKRQKEATEEDLYKLISSYSPTKEEVMPIVEAFRKLLDEIKAVYPNFDISIEKIEKAIKRFDTPSTEKKESGPATKEELLLRLSDTVARLRVAGTSEDEVLAYVRNIWQ